MFSISRLCIILRNFQRILPSFNIKQVQRNCCGVSLEMKLFISLLSNHPLSSLPLIDHEQKSTIKFLFNIFPDPLHFIWGILFNINCRKWLFISSFFFKCPSVFQPSTSSSCASSLRPLRQLFGIDPETRNVLLQVRLHRGCHYSCGARRILCVCLSVGCLQNQVEANVEGPSGQAT